AGAWSAAARATTAHRRGHWPPLGAGPAPAVALLLRRSHDEGSWVGPGSDGITRVTAPHHGDASAPGDPRRPTAGGGPRRVTHARALPRAPMVMTGPSWLPDASSPGRPENASGRRALERDVLVALRSVQKQPTRCASRPKLIRASGATNAAFATADWLTRTTLPATFTS